MNKMAFNLTLQLLVHLETWPYKVRFVIIMDKFKMYKEEGERLWSQDIFCTY